MKVSTQSILTGVLLGAASFTGAPSSFAAARPIKDSDLVSKLPGADLTSAQMDDVPNTRRLQQSSITPNDRYFEKQWIFDPVTVAPNDQTQTLSGAGILEAQGYS